MKIYKGISTLGEKKGEKLSKPIPGITTMPGQRESDRLIYTVAAYYSESMMSCFWKKQKLGVTENINKFVPD